MMLGHLNGDAECCLEVRHGLAQYHIVKSAAVCVTVPGKTTVLNRGVRHKSDKPKISIEISKTIPTGPYLMTSNAFLTKEDVFLMVTDSKDKRLSLRCIWNSLNIRHSS